jgi:hypothetical protein
MRWLSVGSILAVDGGETLEDLVLDAEDLLRRNVTERVGSAGHAARDVHQQFVAQRDLGIRQGAACTHMEKHVGHRQQLLRGRPSNGCDLCNLSSLFFGVVMERLNPKILKYPFNHGVKILLGIKIAAFFFLFKNLVADQNALEELLNVLEYLFITLFYLFSYLENLKI